MYTKLCSGMIIHSYVFRYKRNLALFSIEVKMLSFSLPKNEQSSKTIQYPSKSYCW